MAGAANASVMLSSRNISRTVVRPMRKKGDQKNTPTRSNTMQMTMYATGPLK